MVLSNALAINNQPQELRCWTVEAMLNWFEQQPAISLKIEYGRWPLLWTLRAHWGQAERLRAYGAGRMLDEAIQRAFSEAMAMMEGQIDSFDGGWIDG